MRKAILLAAALGASTVATSGRAEAATWLVSGSGCVIDAEDVGLAHHFGAGIEFRAGLTGEIRLYCPVTLGDGGIEGSGWTLDLYYQDSTGTALGAAVKVQLFRMDLNNGGAGGVCNEISSDASTATGYNIRNSGVCAYNFRPNSELYFARVIMTRSSSTQFVRLYGLSLYL